MADRKKTSSGQGKSGAKTMSKSAAARRAEEQTGAKSEQAGTNPDRKPAGPAPAYGEAAIKVAFEEISAAQPEAAAKQNAATAPKTVSQVLGEITWLMTQSPRHKSIPLGDLEWLMMPAILLKQFRIFYQGDRPVGVAVWAQADDIVAKRIDAGDKRLTSAEWKCGTQMRIVDVVAPFGGEAEMRAQLVGG
ncbi:MAG: hypothetical protein A4S14_05475 [Proteobacteria bacterium SG_bin9]|nr:MAG: hypothetical protein A4S14_05475 [Proteobacteria bacterium SG_bin9]